MATLVRPASIFEDRAIHVKMSAENPLTLLTIFDGSRRAIARGTGHLSAAVAPGLYKLRYSNGVECTDRLASLVDDNRVYDFRGSAPPLRSPIPAIDRDASTERRASVEALLRQHAQNARVVGVVISNPDAELQTTDVRVTVNGSELPATFEVSDCRAFATEVSTGSRVVSVRLAAGHEWAFAAPAPLSAGTWVFLSVARNRKSGRLKLADLAVSCRPLAATRELELLEYARRHARAERLLDPAAFVQYLDAVAFRVDPVLLLFAGVMGFEQAGRSVRLREAITSAFTSTVAEAAPELQRQWVRPPALARTWWEAVDSTADDPFAIPLGSDADRCAPAIEQRGVWLGWNPARVDSSPEILALDLARIDIESSLTDIARVVLDRIGGTAVAIGAPEELTAALTELGRRLQLDVSEDWMLRFSVQLALVTQLTQDPRLFGIDRDNLLRALVQHSALPAATLGRRLYSLTRKLETLTGSSISSVEIRPMSALDYEANDRLTSGEA